MSDPKKYKSWKVVLLSFLGATIFWFFSALGKDYNSRVNYPITFVYNSDSLVAIDPLPTQVRLDVYGGGWDLFRQTFSFGSGDQILIPMENPVATRYITRQTLLPVITDQLDEYRVNFLLTDTLFIHFDERTSKSVKIEIDSLAIDLEKDHRIVSPIGFSADSITIFGPRSFLDTLSDTYRFSLPAKSIDKSFDQFVKLGLPEKWGVRSEPPTINVSFKVAEFENISLTSAIETINFPGDSSAVLDTTNVKIDFVVKREFRDDVSPDKFKPVADYNLLNKKTGKAPILLLFQPEEALEIALSADSVGVSQNSENQ